MKTFIQNTFVLLTIVFGPFILALLILTFLHFLADWLP